LGQRSILIENIQLEVGIMIYSTLRYIRAAVLLLVFVVSIACPARADSVTFTFDGWITEVIGTPPPPFAEATVGSTWTLTYVFDTDTVDIDSNDLAGQYPDPITSMTLTIGAATVTGPPGQAIPGGYGSVIAVNLGPGYADYTAQAGLPDGSAWAQISLRDNDGTPFDNDSLPQVIPAPLETSFPDQRDFFLREPTSTSYFLRGEIAAARVSLTAVRADLQANSEERRVSLLVDSANLGPWGIASGVLTQPGGEVMGVEPSPFNWMIDPDTGTPEDGTAALSFLTFPGGEVMGVEPSPFNWMIDPDTGTPEDGTAALSFLTFPGGEVMGVEPSPFRVLLVSDSDILGELDFTNVSGFFPGILGSLQLTGVRLLLPDGSVLDLDGFDIFDLNDEASLAEMRAELYVDPGGERVSFLANSVLFGSAGLASGMLSTPGGEVMGVEPSPFNWMIDPDTGTPEDGTAALSFLTFPGGEVMGVEPSPFRVLLVSDSDILGELDFSNVSGFLGSLFLEGVRLKLPDDTYIAMESFVTFDYQADSDGDGVLDDDDACPNSDPSPTVVIDGCDTRVENQLSEDGCTLFDLITQCAGGAVNHGEFVSCVAHLTNDLKRDGMITGKEKGKIQKCAAKADIP
jgi:hypothetical protein